MSQTLVISDQLYAHLEAVSQQRGLSSSVQLLEEWRVPSIDNQLRHDTVNRINILRERLLNIYGSSTDSTDLIRQDRDR